MFSLGLTAGNFSTYRMGIAIIILMSIAYAISLYGFGLIMIALAIFALSVLLLSDFLGYRTWVTITVDSYVPITDNAQFGV
jgi:K(+)-stimulated pyrophosphate-energized sodium pump